MKKNYRRYKVDEFCGGVDKIGRIVKSERLGGDSEVWDGYEMIWDGGSLGYVEYCEDEEGRKFIIFERDSEEEFIMSFEGYLEWRDVYG